jgi:hypothetical protein
LILYKLALLRVTVAAESVINIKVVVLTVQRTIMAIADCQQQ